MDSIETKGRLLLWSSAIYETQKLISLAIQCENASKVGVIPKHIKDKRNQAFKEFRQKQPNYVEGTLLSSHLLEFNRMYPEPFPDVQHFHQLVKSNTMLAVIMFSQIYMSGYKDDGAVAGNSKEFVNKHLDNILSEVFTDICKREEYERFVELLLNARNSMLGHADAKAFDVKHGTPVTSFNLHVSAISGIDIRYWYGFLEPLRIAVSKYSTSL